MNKTLRSFFKLFCGDFLKGSKAAGSILETGGWQCPVVGERGNVLQQREKSWYASSLKSRLQYLGPSPGLPCLSEQQDQEFLDHSTGPVGAFCLLVLDPDQVDYLNLKSNQRIKFTSGLSVNGEKCWTSQRINP